MTNSDNGTNPKEKADVPPVLPSEQPSGSEGGGGVLSPEDLDFTESPYVAEVSDGRYVVSSDSPPNVSESTELASRSRSNETRPQQSSETAPMDSNPGDRGSIQSPEVARSILADELERANARYALDIVSRFDSRTTRHRTTSDDVVGTFDNLVLWYAQQVATEMPTHRTAAVLLAKSEFSPPLSPAQVRQAARKHGLNKSSTIGELLDAIE